MPTVFDSLSEALKDNTVGADVAAQSAALAKVASTVAGLIEHPPKNIGDLGSVLQSLPLPNIDVGGDLGKTLGSLSSAIPTDLSSVTGELTGGLDSLQGQLGQLAGPLGKVMEVALAIYQAAQLDLLCLGAPAPPAGGGGSAGTSTPSSGGAQAAAGAPAAAPPPSPLGGLGDILDQLPSPMNVDGLLTWLDRLMHNLDTSNFKLVEIPIFDSLRYPLMTLMDWRNMPPQDILSSVGDTFGNLKSLIAGSVDGPLGAVETALAAVNSQLPAGTLAQVSDQLVAHLGKLQAAIQAKDSAAIGSEVSALKTALDSYAAVQQTVQSGLAPQLAALHVGLPALAGDLADGLGRISSLLQAPSPLSFLPDAPAAIPAAPLGDAGEFIGAISDRVQSLVGRLDLSAIQGPLTTVAQAMQDAIDGLDQAQVKVTLAVQSLFSGVDKLVAQVDIGALLAKVTAAIDDFQAALAGQLQSLFAPVRDALGQVIGEIDQAVNGFNPASLLGAVKDAIGKAAGVLQSADVTSAINDIRSAIEDTAKALESISFAPLTDQVIADIQQVTDSLKKIDTSQLSMALQLALQAALQILPADLTPIANPLIQQLQDDINLGPAKLLEPLQKQPKLLLEALRKYEPAALLGDALSAPFRALLGQMDAFKPSRLLAPVQAELDKLKDRLRQSANPGRLLQPLEELFAKLLQAFDQLRPEKVVEPLNQALSGVIQKAMQALPVDETFQQIDRVLGVIQHVAGIGDQAVAQLQRVIDMLNGLANPRQQVDAWLAGALGNLNSITDASALQPKLDALSAALDHTHAAALSSRFDAAAGPLAAALDALDPQAKLVAIVQAYRPVAALDLGGLAAQDRGAVTAILSRCNPMDAAFGAPYTAAAQVQSLLGQTDSGFQAALGDWDDRFHAAGALAELSHLQASPETLRQWVGQALDAAFARPITAALALFAPLAQTVEPVLEKVKGVVALLDSKLDVLLKGPDSLTGIRDKMKALVDKLKGLNLNFIVDGLNQLFTDLRSKLESIGPAQLHKAIDDAFNKMLDTLQVTLLVPADAVAKLDSDYQAIVDRLKPLDPGALVADAAKVFDQTMTPLLKVFDPSDLLKALLDQFTHLDEKLKAEMARVNQAYQELRDAVPPLHISIDLGYIGASLGF